MGLPDAYLEARERMVANIRASGLVKDARVLAAFAAVPRHEFVSPDLASAAYDDRALPLSDGQTISQPTMIAVMLDQLRVDPHHRALEVGSGCGYALALLARLAARADGIEIRPRLAEQSRIILAGLGVTNAFVHTGNGAEGLPGLGPFDRILVSAGARHVPAALTVELAPAGRIAIPVGGDYGQTLMIGEKQANGDVEWERSIPCMFVPFVE